MKNVWQLQDAKSKFSQVVEQALSAGVQIVTRRGKKAVVVMSFETYERMNNAGSNLAEFLLSSPLANSQLILQRDSGLGRSIEIEE